MLMAMEATILFLEVIIGSFSRKVNQFSYQSTGSHLIDNQFFGDRQIVHPKIIY
jgi:hypothetical protein